ncbi:MAG TPA: ROK family protein [Candidatus Sulfotelmatobacter sp.]|nr:ROK family protein [Candidatus Sulfotelmatobacter sp.]
MSKNSTADGPILGVDIGGTKVAVGLVDREGKILTQGRKPMVANGTAEAALQAVAGAIDSMAAAAEPEGGVHSIGICAPGPLDPKTGVVLNPPNLPCWRNFPLAEKIADMYHVPVKVDNDANAAALAETRWGAARGFRYVFYATIGTGIGTGIVLDGRIYHGSTGSAGEGGHVSIDYRGPRCNCGKLGCIEILAAGPAIGARARSKFKDSPSRPSAILDLANGDVAAITSEMVGKAYAAGDAVAREILQETVDVLTPWLGNIVDLLDPDVLVMGGGVAAMLKPFFDDIKNRLPSWCVNPRVSEIPLLMAHYGADAGIAGGAALCSGELP